MNGRHIFQALLGSWTLSRQIPHYGIMSGTAVFSPIPSERDALLYREEGTACFRGESHRFFKEYIYRYIDSHIIIYFRDDPWRVYHQLRLDHGVYRAHHQCHLDRYCGRYDFCEIHDGKWSMECVVQGPRKEYVIRTSFQRGFLGIDS